MFLTCQWKSLLRSFLIWKEEAVLASFKIGGLLTDFTTWGGGSSAESHLPFDNLLNARGKNVTHRLAQLCHQSKSKPLHCHKCDLPCNKEDTTLFSSLKNLKTESLKIQSLLGSGCFGGIPIMGVFIDLFAQNRLVAPSFYQQLITTSEMASFTRFWKKINQNRRSANYPQPKTTTREEEEGISRQFLSGFDDPGCPEGWALFIRLLLLGFLSDSGCQAKEIFIQQMFVKHKKYFSRKYLSSKCLSSKTSRETVTRCSRWGRPTFHTRCLWSGLWGIRQ